MLSTLEYLSNRSVSPASAMILAAGRGQRMRPLTDNTPKPLLSVRGKPLLQWHLEALVAAGTQAAVINTGWLGDQMASRFGANFQTENGALQLHYSREDLDFGGSLETAGGIARALPLLDDAFWVIAGDIYAPFFPFDEFVRQDFLQSQNLAHLWLVGNPKHNPAGDFFLYKNGLVAPRSQVESKSDGLPSFTYAAIGLLRKELFLPPWISIPIGNPRGIVAPLAPLLFNAAKAQRVSASHYSCKWVDVGTPASLTALNAEN